MELAQASDIGAAKGTSGRACSELALDLIGTPAGLRVLDVGAGTGALAEALAGREAEVVGADLVDQWRAAPLPFRQMDMDERWPFEDGSFDVVALVESLNYTDRIGHVLAEANRVLADEGRVVATVPNCLSLESRAKFLWLGAYRWFPHPIHERGGREDYFDLGRDPVRASTLAFRLAMAGFECERVQFGGRRLGPLSIPGAAIVSGAMRLHNLLRRRPDRLIPRYLLGLDSLLCRNVGIVARKRSSGKPVRPA